MFKSFERFEIGPFWTQINNYKTLWILIYHIQSYVAYSKTL